MSRFKYDFSPWYHREGSIYYTKSGSIRDAHGQLSFADIFIDNLYGDEWIISMPKNQDISKLYETMFGCNISDKKFKTFDEANRYVDFFFEKLDKLAIYL